MPNLKISPFLFPGFRPISQTNLQKQSSDLANQFNISEPEKIKKVKKLYVEILESNYNQYKNKIPSNATSEKIFQYVDQLNRKSLDQAKNSLLKLKSNLRLNLKFKNVCTRFWVILHCESM